MRVPLPAVLSCLAVTGGLAACGGDDGGNPGDYRTAIDAACAKTLTRMSALPRRQADEDLTIAQTQLLADKIGKEFVQTLKDLEPPSELAGPHADLVELVQDDDAARASAATPQALIARLEQSKAAFEKVGATGCAAGQ